MIGANLKINNSIRILRKDDLDLILKWRNHESIRSFMFNKEIIKNVDHVSWFESLATRKDRFAFIFSINEEKKGFAQISLVGNEIAEWGFYVDPYAQPGMGKYLAYNIIEYLFNEMNVRKIVGRVIDFNKRSISLHEKFGFTTEGVLRQEHFDNNTYHDVICFGLLKNEWTGKGK